MNPALASVLARPDVWRGDALAVAPAPTLATGFAELDAELPGGGWPRGQLTELLHEQAGIGELSLLLPALAWLTRAGKTVMMIAARHSGGTPHAPAWAAAGLDLAGVYWVEARASRDSLWAAVESLRCGGVAATLIWSAPRESWANNSLRRLQTAAAEGGGCAFLYRPARDVAQASPAPLRLRLLAQDDALQVDVFKRRGMPLRQPLRLALARPAPLRSVSYALAGTRSAVPARPARLPA